MFILSKKRLLILVIIIILLIVGTIGIYYGRAVKIKMFGTRVKPSEVYKPREVKFFLQNNPQWRSDRLGDSKFTLGSSGCLVSVLATALNDLGYQTNPQDLNHLFTNHGAYTRGGAVIWYKINEIIPGIKYSYQRFFNGKTLEQELAQGRLPIVKVKYHKTGIFHWVLIVGANEEEFLIIDPLVQDEEIIELKTHGRVYAYRVLSKTN